MAACAGARLVLELDPGNLVALAILAFLRNRCAVECGNECITEARQTLRRAIAEREPCADASYYLGLMESEEGRRDLARRHFKTALRIDPDHERARRQLTLAEIRDRSSRQMGFRG
ncbi:tetratricopeptide repeat protein [bacterium]|nr:tetratricopeptide repeat protein [bacterium]